ncbi:MAG: AAA family ATPase [Ruminococcus sp.]|nr:AAA family ATPase [Ruminococcus sp.]
MSVKIKALEVENVKRVKAVTIEPTASGLTIIGGKNNQGKTSILDSIAWALGGEKYRPSQAQRDGSVIPPHLKLTLSNGLVVERSGKNSSLKVIDPNGKKSGQQLLNSFVEVLALDLPKFMESSSKDKANTLLKIIGVGDTLYKLDSEEQKLYNQRHAIGTIADQKKKFAKEMLVYEGVPAEPISASELIAQQQEILVRNGENRRKRENLAQLEIKQKQLSDRISQYEAELLKLQSEYSSINSDIATAKKSTEKLVDESTAELEKNISEIDEINRKIRANLDREKAEIEAEGYSKQYDTLSRQIEDIRMQRRNLLDNADMPLPELSVKDGELTYKGYQWDNMSGSDQLKISTAIVRKLNPECGFVLLDKLEQMDTDTLSEFGKWLEEQGLQAIATRVSTGDECSIIIEDGYVKAKEVIIPEKPESVAWKPGQF